MRITATIQARMGSTRFPGKVLKKICGKPLLALQIERIRQSMLIDDIIIATSELPNSDPIEALAREMDEKCYRGSEEDVLGRVIETLREYRVETHIEFTGDNPMPDPLLVDSIIGFYLKNMDRYDYVTNALKTTYPPGAEVIIYNASTLYDAAKYVDDPKYREHVGFNIYSHPERYRIHNIEAPPWHHMPDLHLEVDTKEDFEVVSNIFEEFYPKNPGFSLSQVIDYIKHRPELMEKNRTIERRWRKYRKD